ncbi:hypothetical protein MNBD_NITROSPINAE02-2149 [hydrothermal vent metagenome]|uniref:Outer membrane cytochrome MtrC/MtrF-like domain-containing protein n=1 Tax=hydrothermal vent metagenome TaxID=652676 RepID=A0A3B1BKC6_9ZZZZ
MSLVLAVFGISNIIFLLAIVSQWRNLRGWTGKTVVFTGILVFPLLWGTIVASHNLEVGKETGFCAKCHVMTPYVDSLKVDDDEPLSAVHYQNNWVPKKYACYACHTQYTVFGPVKAKLSGLKHLYIYYFTDPPEKLKLYAPYENRECLRCHGPSKKFLEHKKHKRPKGLLRKIMNGDKSCMARGCHELGHLLASDLEDDEDDF